MPKTVKRKKDYKPENIKRLNRITEIGEGNPVLNYVKYFKDLFSPGFLAIPNKNDVKNWQNNYQITWTIDSDNAVLAENIDDEIKTILQQEKEKLVNTIIKLENEIEGETKGKLDKQQAYYIYKNFSFDWDNPEGKVYKTDDGIAIISWGLCSKTGKPYDVPVIPSKPGPEPKEGYSTKVPQGLQDGNSNTDDGKPLIPKKYRLWLLIFLALLMAFLLKNCRPHAEISLIDQSPKVLWEKGDEIITSIGSHDSTSIFSKGFLKETSIKDLDEKWNYYKWDEIDTIFYLIDKIPTKMNGVYLVQLKITDDGNKLKFWKRDDIDDLLITVFIDTTVIHHYSEKTIIPYGGGADIPKEKLLVPLYLHDPLNDVDGDGTPNSNDVFPVNPNESKDSDRDGKGDNSDVFPDDPYEQNDNDGDGFGSNSDPDDNDPNNPPPKPLIIPGDGSGGKAGDGSGGKAGDGSGGKAGDGSELLNGDDERFYDGEKLIRKYQNCWVRITSLQRNSPSDLWRTVKIEYVDPDGNVHNDYPFQDKESVIDLEKEKVL